MTAPAPRTLPRSATTELGVPDILDPGGMGANTYEATPELQYPLNLAVFDRMRRTDSQIRGISRAVKLPMLGTRWSIRGGREEVRAMVEAELGLARDDEDRLITRPNGVSWTEFLRHALLHLDFGHMPFEQVYEIGRPEVPGLPAGLYRHLRKLAPRMPRSLSAIDVATDGGLQGIRQARLSPRPGEPAEIRIPVDRLVMFANEREGADWAGQSIYRSAYKHWLIKDVLIRLGALGVDRTGMGLPVVTYPSGDGDSGRTTALAIARSVRAGEDSGVALSEGYTLSLLGVTGSVADPLPWVKYHDQAMSRSALAMFLDLGHDAGARSLGDTFVDLFLLAEQAHIAYLEETIRDHVIRDLVRENFGETEPVPTIVADKLSAETLTAQALGDLAGAGLLGTIDPGLQAEVRRRYGLPTAVHVEVPGVPTPPGQGAPQPPTQAPAGVPVDRIVAPTVQPPALPAVAPNAVRDGRVVVAATEHEPAANPPASAQLAARALAVAETLAALAAAGQ